MACQAIQLWTFNGLVAAFLDLGIAYLLLCASSLVFFTSKFLALFGLCLPCPCDGLFGNLSSDHCFQKLLVDRSSKKIFTVLHSTREKFPLVSILDPEPNCCFNSMLVQGRNVEEANVELEGEASGGSGVIYGDFSGVKDSDAVAGLTYLKEEGKFYNMGNGVSFQGPGNSLHHRCKGGVGHGKAKVISVSAKDILRLDMEDVSQSPSSFSEFGENDTEGSFFSVDSEDGREASSDNSDQDKVFPVLELGDSHDEKICVEMYESSVEEAGNNCRRELHVDGNESDTIKLLEQALEEEQTARATLYLELEKERSAAATAADEAMSMILRLQEEKASIEMDARQYQRMIEEKTTYDAEEMSILKEILVRREREMHFLEKEVEAYRKSFIGDEYDGMDVDMLDLEATPQRTPSFPYLTEDPSHMLRCIDRCISEKQDTNYTKHSLQYETPSTESRNLTFEFGEESSFSQADELAGAVKSGGMPLHQVADSLKDGEEIENELQEKGMVEDENSYILQGEVNVEPYLQSNESNGLGVVAKSTGLIADEREKVDKVSYDGLASSKTILPWTEYNLEKNNGHQNQRTKDLNSVTDTDPHPHDIHIIDDEASANASKKPVFDGNLSFPVKCDSPSFRLLGSELDIKRSSSDATGRFPPMGCSRSTSLRSELRRNSMSAVDYERSKIGNEVEWLRERLKIVQEGREKLKFTVEHKEKENNQLQLLEDTTNHLREIRQLTDPGKATLQAPLPPSSKAVPKKQCWRSSSLSIHRSS